MTWLDKEKLLEWTNFGLERGVVLRESFQGLNDVEYWKVVGGQKILTILAEQLELGTFGAPEANQLHEDNAKLVKALEEISKYERDQYESPLYGYDNCKIIARTVLSDLRGREEQ